MTGLREIYVHLSGKGPTLEKYFKQFLEPLKEIRQATILEVSVTSWGDLTDLNVTNAPFNVKMIDREP